MGERRTASFPVYIFVIETEAPCERDYMKIVIDAQVPNDFALWGISQRRKKWSLSYLSSGLQEVVMVVDGSGNDDVQERQLEQSRTYSKSSYQTFSAQDLLKAHKKEKEN